MLARLDLQGSACLFQLGKYTEAGETCSTCSCCSFDRSHLKSCWNMCDMCVTTVWHVKWCWGIARSNACHQSQPIMVWPLMRRCRWVLELVSFQNWWGILHTKMSMASSFWTFILWFLWWHYDDMMISYLMISLRSKGYFRAGRAALEFWPELTKPTRMVMASTSHLWKPRMEFYSEALELFQQGLEKEPGILDAEFLDVEVLMTIYQCIDLEHNFYINIPAYNSCYSYWCLVEFHQLHVHFGHPEAQQQRPGSLDPESPRHQKSTSAGRFTPGTGENLQLDSWNPGFVTMDIWYYWSCTHDFEVKGEVGEEAHHWLFEIWLSGSAAERRRGWGGGSHYKSDWHSYHLVAPNAARPPMIPTASSWVTSAHEQKINRFYPDTRHYQIADVKSKHSMSCENPDQIFIVPP